MEKKEKGEEEMEAILFPIKMRGRRQVLCPRCDSASLCAEIKEKKECPYCGQKLRIPEKKLRERRNKK